MSAFLFVHFREKTAPDGEQVRFGLSRDGFHWESLNNGDPVLWTYVGTHGTRDFAIARNPKTGRFTILGTDLSISYGTRRVGKENFWRDAAVNGSKDLIRWESDDLIHWTESEPITVGREDFGCCWAPEILYDTRKDEYLVHWSSSIAADDYRCKSIFYSCTKDFHTFTPAESLYRVEGHDNIDSAMYEEDGKYYFFLKSERNPGRMMLFSGDSPTGPFERMTAFDECMAPLEEGKYEAPTAVKLDDGRWCLFLDYYGARGDEQGYVPFLCDDIKTGVFVRSDEQFSFPYGYKHGCILKITNEEYDRLKAHDWSDKGYDW